MELANLTELLHTDLKTRLFAHYMQQINERIGKSKFKMTKK